MLLLCCYVCFAVGVRSVDVAVVVGSGVDVVGIVAIAIVVGVFDVAVVIVVDVVAILL